MSLAGHGPPWGVTYSAVRTPRDLWTRPSLCPAQAMCLMNESQSRLPPHLINASPANNHQAALSFPPSHIYIQPMSKSCSPHLQQGPASNHLSQPPSMLPWSQVPESPVTWTITTAPSRHHVCTLTSLRQTCPRELSVMVEMLYICAG